MSDPLALAFAHLRAARFTEAEWIARDLANDPSRAADARHLLGLVALHTGNPEEARTVSNRQSASAMIRAFT